MSNNIELKDFKIFQYSWQFVWTIFLIKFIVFVFIFCWTTTGMCTAMRSACEGNRLWWLASSQKSYDHETRLRGKCSSQFYILFIKRSRFCKTVLFFSLSIHFHRPKWMIIIQTICKKVNNTLTFHGVALKYRKKKFWTKFEKKKKKKEIHHKWIGFGLILLFKSWTYFYILTRMYMCACVDLIAYVEHLSLFFNGSPNWHRSNFTTEFLWTKFVFNRNELYSYLI